MKIEFTDRDEESIAAEAQLVKTTVRAGCTIKPDPSTGLLPVLNKVADAAREAVLTLASQHDDPHSLMNEGTIVVSFEVVHDPKGEVPE